ncbi:MAG: ribbon-helix-helix domain-containing protein [Hyphomicrobiales bacterium]|uniref:ribbon-helix-helix domain-containing protein n=1 Tax=Rhabdaerophilum calidifontis TaxID=2604328 RepID=UPI00123883FF|nr:ribbon-helix-helix domain-containing protein [Rhabdaerophilum calidifontis]MCA1953341.1 ribbon-helix-helix domain-containing protein [Hyphomicrobiales bacterium]MCA1999468.1 ribbon-helix-helix domain-containing protein [Hyphomicrobiales bacterium]
MCRLFVEADPILWQNASRSLRINGFATSLRLENLFWNVLEEIARRDGMTTNELICRLHDEMQQNAGDVENFTSFLRVCCGRYLRLQADGAIPADDRIPLRSLDADAVLARERRPAAWRAGASL